MPDSNLADGSVLTSSFYNTYIREQVVVTCTSGTRPSGVEGRVIYETDTNRWMGYETTTPAWRVLGGGHWEAFTPSWTNLTLGNGTESAEYRYMPGELQVRGYITFGSTTSISGSVQMAVPNSETIRSTAAGLISSFGSARYRDAGSSVTNLGDIQYSTSTAVLFLVWNASSTYLTANALSSTVPFTWATSDQLRYEYRIPVS